LLDAKKPEYEQDIQSGEDAQECSFIEGSLVRLIPSDVRTDPPGSTPYSLKERHSLTLSVNGFCW